ncbi:MAG: TlpA disulfide reductase family protein [Planctomycetota bacterium]
MTRFIGRVVVVSLCSLFCSTLILSADATKPVEAAAKVDDILGALKGTGAKVILVNVWSAECTPCIAEMPTLMRAAVKFKSNANVAFLGLCLPGEETNFKIAIEAATKIVQSKVVTYRNMLWTGKGETLLDRFNIIGTPYIVFLSGDGKVLGDLELPEDQVKAGDMIEKSIAKALAVPATSDAPKKL